jgi:hypothetical protein
MFNNFWLQAGGMGVIAFLFWYSMRELATATRENTKATARLAGLLEAVLPQLTGRAPAPVESEAVNREQLRSDPADGRSGAAGFRPYAPRP